jgi:hypothetical protein
MTEIRAQYTTDADTMRPGIRLGMRMAAGKIRLGLVAAFLLFFAAAVLQSPPQNLLPYMAAVATVSYALFMVPINTELALRGLKKAPHYGDPVEWIFTEDKLRSRTPKGAGDTSYTAFVKTVTAPEGMLFYVAPRLYNWLPRSAFTSEEDYQAVARLLAERTPNVTRN